MNKPITKKEWMEYLEKTWDAAQEEALAQLEQKPVPWESFFNRYCPWLEQPEQEPMGDAWTPCMKLPVVVHVRKQRPGEAHVSTREGITPVKPDDLIMRGVSGEEYPIGRAIFEQTYTLDTATPQRKPLTDNELADLWYKQSTDWLEFGRAIEAAHGIKENT